jgi:hypothetical protein
LVEKRLIYRLENLCLHPYLLGKSTVLTCLFAGELKKKQFNRIPLMNQLGLFNLFHLFVPFDSLPSLCQKKKLLLESQ